jgi:hypothetical protein
MQKQNCCKAKTLKRREVQISKLVHNQADHLVNTCQDNYHLVGFAARLCTANTRLFRLFNMQNGALRAPTLPIAASLILPAKLMIYRENFSYSHGA